MVRAEGWLAMGDRQGQWEDEGQASLGCADVTAGVAR
jgi:hypothetical protein